jgi:para-aminobenzoate synthetase component I
MHTVPIPYREPEVAFTAFASSPCAVLLDYDTGGRNVCLIAADPVETVTAAGEGGFINGVWHSPDPFATIEEVWRRYASRRNLAGSFSGALIGYLGYELGGFLEKLPPPKADILKLPGMSFGAYDTAAFFDRRQRRAWVSGADASKAAGLAGRLAAAPWELPPPKTPALGWEAEQSQAEAEANIRRIIDYIGAGDIFQANYTQRFLAKRPAGLNDFSLYRRLRSISPAPFSAFLRCGDISLASASPERFLSLDGKGLVTAEPIKGTRPRGSDPARDAALASALLESAKDKAENLMIVDLMRNDLSRVCRIGSVTVPHLYRLESFAQVHHLVSTVTGHLRGSVTPIGVLRAAFPGGSVTGAPKIRAMQIIQELEPAPRGAYCGAYGWIGFDGSADLAMTIRTLTLTPDWIAAQAGGGIVADSDPAAEYEESMVKIAPLLQAGLGEGE